MMCLMSRWAAMLMVFVAVAVVSGVPSSAFAPASASPAQAAHIQGGARRAWGVTRCRGGSSGVGKPDLTLMESANNMHWQAEPPHQHNTNQANGNTNHRFVAAAKKRSRAAMASGSAGAARTAARARTVLAAAMSKYAETSEVVTEKLTNKRARYVTTNVMAGLATAMAVIPEAAMFALIIPGMHPLDGLGSAVIMALSSAMLGGRPGLVAAAGASLCLVLAPLGVSHGRRAVSLAVAMAGVVQYMAGVFKFGAAVRMVPDTVMMGILNGCAIKMAVSQFHHFRAVPLPGVEGLAPWLSGAALYWHAAVVAACYCTIEFLPLVPKIGKLLPSPLIALTGSLLVADKLNLPIPRIQEITGEFAGGLSGMKRALAPAFYVPDLMAIPTKAEFVAALPYALEVGLLGAVYSLLTLQLVDSITKDKGHTAKELKASGFGNVVAGLLGGVGGGALTGQSVINVNTGGTGRLSGVACGAFVVLGVVFCAPFLGRLPVASLVGLMFVICKHIFRWNSIRFVTRVPLADAMTVVGTSVFATKYGLAQALVGGVLLSALRYAWEASHQISTRVTQSAAGHRVVKIKGNIFFGSASSFARACEPTPKERKMADDAAARQDFRHNNPGFEGEILDVRKHVHIDLGEAVVMDQSGIKALDDVIGMYEDCGITLHLKNLSPDCRALLASTSTHKNAVLEESDGDPVYHVAVDPAAGNPAAAGSTAAVNGNAATVYTTFNPAAADSTAVDSKPEANNSKPEVVNL